MKKLFLILTTICLMGSVWAEEFSLQGKKDNGGNTKLKVGIAMPMGDFASHDGVWVLQSGEHATNVAGYAKRGFNVGIQQRIDLHILGLGLLIEADLFYNEFNADSLLILNSNTEVTPRSFNLPVMIGADIHLPLGDKLALMAEAGIGVNFRYVTKWEDQGDLLGLVTAGYSNRYNVANSVAYKAGVGLLLGNVFSIELQYLNLGAAPLSGTTHWASEVAGILGGDTDIDFNTGSMETSMLNLCIGYRF